MIEETMPNAFLGDQLIRLELLRGIPADYLMVQLPKIGWWLTPPDGGKLLLVDSECYASTYTNPIQTQRIFEAVLEADCALFVCHQGGSHFISCRGFPSYLKPEMIEETMPNAFLGDQLIRLELLRGIPADYLMVQLPKIGWWLTPPDGGKLLLVDSECYASTYTNPIQTQRIFEAVLEADCALFVCHQGGSHFMAGFIVRPAEALKPLDQREFQSMIVITDTLASSVNSIPNEPSDRLLDGLRLALEVNPADLFPVVKLLGPSQMAGNNCGIFTYLALLRFLQTPTMFDMVPGGDSLVSDATRGHVRTWSSPEIARQIRVQLHKDYSTFWKHKPPAVWSMRRQDDLNSLLDDPNWPQFLPDMLRLLDPTKGVNNLRSIHAGLFSPTILLDFLQTGGDISDVFADVLFRVHPTEPERIIAPCPFTLGDYNLNSHRHYNSHRFYQGLQEGDYSPVPYVESGAVPIITAVTKETEILFIPIFTVSGHLGLGLGSVPHKSITDNFLIRKAPGRNN